MCEQEAVALQKNKYIGKWILYGFKMEMLASLQAWYDTSRSSDIRTWTRADLGQDPFKAERSPLMAIPGADDPWRVRTDPAHTFAIQGYGSSAATSAIVLLARLNFVQGQSVPIKLEALYDKFITWCRGRGKSTSLESFLVLKFHMNSHLAWEVMCCRFASAGSFAGLGDNSTTL